MGRFPNKYLFRELLTTLVVPNKATKDLNTIHKLFEHYSQTTFTVFEPVFRVSSCVQVENYFNTLTTINNLVFHKKE